VRIVKQFLNQRKQIVVFIALTELYLAHQFKKIKVAVKKPTLKAIHICNYSRFYKYILVFVNFVSHQPKHKPKIAKEYAFANTKKPS